MTKGYLICAIISFIGFFICLGITIYSAKISKTSKAIYDREANKKIAILSGFFLYIV